MHSGCFASTPNAAAEVLSAWLDGDLGLAITEVMDLDEELYREGEWKIQMFAEVTTPSLGVGYELAFAEKLNKPILCLYQNNNSKSLSAMISGNKNLICKTYKIFSEVQIHIQNFIQNIESI